METHVEETISELLSQLDPSARRKMIWRFLALDRWQDATKAQKRLVGRMLGDGSKNWWANKTEEEKSAIMRERAEVREENRRRKERGEAPLPPKPRIVGPRKAPQ